GMNAAAEGVYYLPSPNKDQFQVVPVFVSVLIDQARIPDLLVEFQNSPMGIQVLEVQITKPASRVKKPVKGQAMSYGDYSGMMMGGYGERILGGRGMMESMMGGYGEPGMMEMMMRGRMGIGMRGGYGGMMGGPAVSQRKGVDQRAKLAEQERKKKEEAKE